MPVLKEPLATLMVLQSRNGDLSLYRKVLSALGKKSLHFSAIDRSLSEIPGLKYYTAPKR